MDWSNSIHIMVAKHGASGYLPTLKTCAIKIAQFCSSISNYIYVYIYTMPYFEHMGYIYIILELVSEPLHHVHHGRSQISTVLLGTEHRLGWMPRLDLAWDFANRTWLYYSYISEKMWLIFEKILGLYYSLHGIFNPAISYLIQWAWRSSVRVWHWQITPPMNGGLNIHITQTNVPIEIGWK